MSDHALPRVARRIIGRPHLISPDGARAVLTALAPRLGIRYLVDPAGQTIDLQAAPPAATARNAGAPERDWDDGRPFAFDAGTGIAYVPIEGELVHRFGHLDPWSGMTGYDGLKVKLDAAAADPEARGILLDFDTPGGEANGLEGAAEAIERARRTKPVWALVNEMALSAGYWLASAADQIIVPPLGDVGSIGAVIMHEDISGMLEGLGVRITLIAAPEDGRKTDGSPFDPLSDEARAWFQARVDTAYGRFVAAVARNRGLSEAAVRETQAAVLQGADGVAAGLADAVGSEDEVWDEFAARLDNQPRALIA